MVGMTVWKIVTRRGWTLPGNSAGDGPSSGSSNETFYVERQGVQDAIAVVEREWLNHGESRSILSVKQQPGSCFVLK